MMNNELLLLNKSHTGTLFEKTITKPQETLDFKVKELMQKLSVNPPKPLSKKESGY